MRTPAVSRYHTRKGLDGGGSAHRRLSSRAERFDCAFMQDPVPRAYAQLISAPSPTPSSYHSPSALRVLRTLPTTTRSARLGRPCRHARLCTQRRLHETHAFVAMFCILPRCPRRFQVCACTPRNGRPPQSQSSGTCSILRWWLLPWLPRFHSWFLLPCRWRVWCPFRQWG